MTQPLTYGGRPATPAPGTVAPERRIVRLRRHARVLAGPALLLIAVAGAVGYLYGNLPAPLTDPMLLGAAVVVVFVGCVLPFLVWWTRTWTITTTRVIERTGVFVARRRELPHVRGYAVRLSRGVFGRLWRSGTLTLTDGVAAPLVLRSVPAVDLVHECLVDQVEVGQILAHRELPLPGVVPPLSPGVLPPRPPAP